MPKHMRSRTVRGLICGVSIFAFFIANTAQISFAEENSNTQLNALRKLADTARQNAEADQAARAAAAEQTRRQLSTLSERMDTATAQNELIMLMMGQILATQAGTSVEGRAKAEMDAFKEQSDVAEEAINELTENAKTSLEEELAEKTAQFEKIIEDLPTEDDLKEWSEAEINRVKEETERVKAEVDAALDKYVEEQVIPNISKNCRGTSAYEQRQLVSQAREGADAPSIGEELTRLGCSEVEDLTRQLSQARNAEEAQTAFQNSMQSLMMAAMMSGNPYVAAIAAVLMLLSALFSDGNGDGDGDGVDDQPGGGPIEGAPDPSGAAASGIPAENPAQNPAENPAQNPAENPAENPAQNPVEATNEKIDPRTTAKIKSAGGNPDVQAHPGVGCQYDFFNDNKTVLSFDRMKGQPTAAFDIDITDIEGVTYDNFPETWTDKTVRLVSCDFDKPSVLIQFDAGGSTLCLRIQKLQAEGGGFELSDTGFGLGANRVCEAE